MRDASITREKHLRFPNLRIVLHMHEIAEFLRDNPPFDTLSEEELDEVAAACEIEFAEAGTMVLEQAVTTPGVAWVVRRGAVELLDGDRVVDM